jgi:hypothetical protein
VPLERAKGEDLGDLDVLAANPESKLVACLEVKSLAGALAPHQLRNELDTTFAPAGGKRSAAVKCVERTQIVRANVPAVLALLGIDGDPGSWSVGVAILTDPEVLSPLLEACPVPVISLEQFVVLLANQAFPQHLAFAGQDA